MEIFGGNWCKLVFVFLASTYTILAIFTHFVDRRRGFFESIKRGYGYESFRYGKLTVDVGSQKSSLTIPKSYFKTFYSLAAFVYAPVALYEVVNVYILDRNPSEWFIWFLDTSCGSHRAATATATHSFLASSLVILQIWRRFYDTHFVVVHSKRSSAQLTHLPLGLLFYMGVLLIILNEAPKFAPTVGQRHDSLRLTDISLLDVIAAGVFLWAWYHQHVTTAILGNLRRNRKGEVVTESYKIPQGDWFEYLSSPHVVAELLIYTSLWVILGFGHGWWCVYFLVVVNQLDSLIVSHEWYQKTFKDFPRNRKILIPYVI